MRWTSLEEWRRIFAISHNLQLPALLDRAQAFLRRAAHHLQYDNLIVPGCDALLFSSRWSKRTTSSVSGPPSSPTTFIIGPAGRVAQRRPILGSSRHMRYSGAPGGPTTSISNCSRVATRSGASGGPSDGGGSSGACAGLLNCGGRKNSSKPPGAMRPSMRTTSVSKVYE